MKYRELLIKGTETLRHAGIPDAAADGWYLLEYVSGMSRNTYFLRMEEEAPGELCDAYGRILEKRCARIPLQYITGEQEFMGLTFLVNEHVLVPRQDTETLVEQAEKKLLSGMCLLDLCTGSGCILISLLARVPGVIGLGTDISAEALETAEKNADRLGVGDRARWTLGDIFAPVEGRFDVIVSNPPYIRREDIDGLMPEVADFEPREALDGGRDGLEFYRRIISEAPEYLKEGGWLFFEIGCDQAEDVTALMRETGFVRTETAQDLSGLDRVVYGCLPEKPEKACVEQIREISGYSSGCKM